MTENSNNFKINPFTLKFIDSKVEYDFFESISKNIVVLNRVAFFLGALNFSSLAILDYNLNLIDFQTQFNIRLTLTFILFLFFLLSYKKYYIKVYKISVIVLLLLSTYSHFLFKYINSIPDHYLTFVVCNMIIYSFFFSGLNFFISAILSYLYIFSFLIFQVYFYKITYIDLYYYLSWMSTAAFICLFSFYLFEAMIRRNFILKNLLANEKSQAEKALFDLKEAQSQLIESERMASLGQLVGGVAHEINNPIAVIRSNSELLRGNINSILKEVPKFLSSLSEEQTELFYSIINTSLKNKEFLSTKEERARKKGIMKELEESIKATPEKLDFLTEQILLLKLKSPYKDYIEKLGESKFIQSLSIAQIFVGQSNSIGSIEIAVEKAARVIFALRNYLNTEMFSEKKEVNLSKEVEKAIHLYDNYILGKVNIYKDFITDCKITCVVDNLSQIWKNLIFNSIQAMYDTEKKMELRLEKVSSLPAKLKQMRSSVTTVEEKLERNSWIIFSIIDSGSGITENSQGKIFSPFFTTKALGEGIGLGLYVSRKIVHEHGGQIYFESSKGRTEFVVVLPN